MIYGTANFASLAAACRYYAAQGFNASDVARKITEGEIHIGKPAPPYAGDLVTLNTAEGRYFVTEGEPFPIGLIGDPDHAARQAELVANLKRRNRTP